MNPDYFLYEIQNDFHWKNLYKVVENSYKYLTRGKVDMLRVNVKYFKDNLREIMNLAIKGFSLLFLDITIGRKDIYSGNLRLSAFIKGFTSKGLLKVFNL